MGRFTLATGDHHIYVREDIFAQDLPVVGTIWVDVRIRTVEGVLERRDSADDKMLQPGIAFSANVHDMLTGLQIAQQWSG